MPNWTNDEGESMFAKLICKRCQNIFDTDKKGEIPTHKCLNGDLYKSESSNKGHIIQLRSK